MNEVWVTIACRTMLEAITYAVKTTGNFNVSFSGDFGQDEGEREVGMGNDDYSVVVRDNGTAILRVREEDNNRYLAPERI